MPPCPLAFPYTPNQMPMIGWYLAIMQTTGGNTGESSTFSSPLSFDLLIYFIYYYFTMSTSPALAYDVCVFTCDLFLPCPARWHVYQYKLLTCVVVMAARLDATTSCSSACLVTQLFEAR